MPARAERPRPTIGVLAGWQVYWTTTPLNFLDPLLHGIRAAAADRGCNLLLACGIDPSADPGGIRPAWPELMEGEGAEPADFVPVGPWNTTGLIVVNPLLSEARLQYVQTLAAAGHPLVFVGAAEGRPAVGVDNAGGICQALAHLAEHGHRRVAFIAGQPADEAGDSGERLRAYQAAVRAYGLAADPALIAYGHHMVSGGERAMRQLLDAGVEFSAVLASNDESGFGAMRVLKAAGLRIPEDVAVIGFDDRPEALVQEPALTSVHSPTFEQGYQALELLLAHIAGQPAAANLVEIPTRLVVRHSCGCRPEHGQALLPGRRAEEAGRPSLEQRMAEAVLVETRRLTAPEVQLLCGRLLEGFTASLAAGQAAAFRGSLEEIRARVTAADDDAHAWQAGLSVLRSELAAVLAAAGFRDRLEQAEDLLHLARLTLSAATRWQYSRYATGQREMADRLGLLTAHLLTARQDEQIFQILATHLPQVGLRHVEVAFFEPQGDDPVAGSRLFAPLAIPGGTPAGPVWFPSRQFPPPGLYPPGEPFSLALLPLEIAGQPAGYTVFDAANLAPCAAITRQLGQAFHSARLYQAATEARRLAEEANRMKSRFLSTVSHELRTPLNLIVSLSESLLQPGGGEGEQPGSEVQPGREDQDRIEQIHTSAQHLGRLIRDVLDLASSDAGQLKLVCAPLELAEAFGMVVRTGEHLAHSKGLEWQVDLPGGLPRVWGDRTRLQQVALNLVSNAIKFTAHGEVRLQVYTAGAEVVVAVSDTGLGISPDEQAIIFDEFRQSERTTARGYGGLGLGLAICKRLVELHGGRIWVYSRGEEGGGSTFFFSLPVMTGPDGYLPGLKREQAAAEAGAQPPAVMVLTEDATAGERLRQHLQQQGYTVAESRTTAGGVPGSAWLPALLADPPGAVVLDLQLAGERGWEVLKVLKDNPVTREIPVLFYSLEQESNAGAVLDLDYLTKPVGSRELAQALTRQGFLGDPVQAAGKTILVADDEPGILEMHSRMLLSLSPHFRVLKANNGRQALAILGQERVDLILLDLMMPELDGFGVLEAIQGRRDLLDIPVIVLTGQVLTEGDMARLNQGVAAILDKGVYTVKETLAHVETALGRSRRLGSEAQRLVRRVLAYMHAHYAESLSRDALAAQVGASAGHLARCFQQETGMTPLTYLNRYRINQAKVLLAEGALSITQVAQAVGFADSAHFNRVFRQEVGITPGAYRRGERS